MGYPSQYTDGYHSLKVMFDCSPVSRSEIAHALIMSGVYPASMDQKTAENRINLCLSRSKDSFFKQSEINFIMKLTGRRDPLYYACDCLSLERPQPKDINAEILALESSIEEGVRALNQAVSRLHDLQLTGASRIEPVRRPENLDHVRFSVGKQARH